MPWRYNAQNYNSLTKYMFKFKFKIFIVSTTTMYEIQQRPFWQCEQHYTTLHIPAGKLVVLQTQHKTKTHIYRYTHACTCTRLKIYTHLQTHTYTCIYIYINIIHLTHGARAPPFCHPLSLSNHSKSRWQSGGNHIEWDTHLHTLQIQVTTPHRGEMCFRHFRSTIPPQA